MSVCAPGCALRQAAPTALPAAGQPPEWGHVIAAANVETKTRKKREDYVDWPCSKVDTNPLIKKHGTYTTWEIGREIIHKR